MNLKLPALCRKYFNKQKYKPHYKLYLIPKTNSLSEIIIFHMGTDSKGEVVCTRFISQLSIFNIFTS